MHAFDVFTLGLRRETLGDVPRLRDTYDNAHKLRREYALKLEQARGRGRVVEGSWKRTL